MRAKIVIFVEDWVECERLRVRRSGFYTNWQGFSSCVTAPNSRTKNKQGKISSLIIKIFQTEPDEIKKRKNAMLFHFFKKKLWMKKVRLS